MGDLRDFDKAISEGQCDVVESMLKNGFKPYIDTIIYPCETGDSNMIEILIQRQMDLDEGFLAAAINNQVAVLNRLYLEGVDINYKNLDDKDTALHLALSNDPEEEEDCTDACKWLLDMGALQLPNKHGLTPICWPCLHNDIEMVKLMASKLGDVPTNYWDDPLRFAQRGQSREVIEFITQILIPESSRSQ